ncbi:TonB-dependent siderophore receptor [Aliarcobacter butzleri]|uniref:TonB-dependent siderophore receptor n=1 Tax=Aliarcobacter butzleri TaxID=28197 RepID=UPI00214B6D82|nr:TonB-dependent siderophore receptor [Aliarcobacter butzleri]MCP3650020.1 TonB-dependent siderophore receptor [Arcobacter sp. DNRA7]MCR1816193.1 TonB-dependent siderophore receptor [Aliarcobacter butzleri]
MTQLKAKFITSASAILLCGSLLAQDVYTVKNMSLKQALEKISKESKLAYIVDESLISGKTAPNIENVQGLKNALNQVLNGSGLEATIEKGTIIIEKIVGQGTVLETISVNEGYSNGSAQSGYVVKELKQVGPWGEKSLQDTPYSMSVTPQELIENSIAGDMDQIYKMNPVIQNSAPTSVYGTPYAAIRGFHTQSGIMDGLRLSSTSTGIAMEELERVEVINGLTGFMYGVSGSEGIGGTTNYVLKRPTYKRLTNLTVGNYGNQQWFGHIDLGDKIDEKGKFAYRLNVSHQDGETGKDNQNVERTLVSGALDWNVTDDFQLQLEAAHTYYRIDGIDSRFYAYKDSSYGALNYWIKPLKNDKTYTPDWTYLETKTDRVGVNALYSINDIFTFRSAYMYKEDRQESINLYPAYFADSGWVNGWTSKSAPSWNIAQGAYAYLDSEFSTGNIKHKLTSGVSGDILDVKRYQNSSISAANSPAYDNASDLGNWTKPSILNASWDYGKKYKSSKSTNSNIILGDDVTFNENWSALVGYNYTTVETKNFNSSGDTTSKYDKSEFTPTVSVIFKPFEDLTTYVSYMEGLQKGSTVPDDAVNYKDPGKILDPYISYQYEVGAKYAISEKLLISSALFRIEKANTLNERGSDGKITVSQDGLQIHQGLELTTTGKITDDLTLITGGTIMDIEVDKATDKTLEGKKPTGVSSVLAKIYAEYNIPQISGLTLTGGAYHSGSMYKDSANLQKIDSHTIYDAGLRYKTKLDKYPTTFNLNVANLTDEDYWATTFSLGIPRTLAFSMKVEF